MFSVNTYSSFITRLLHPISAKSLEEVSLSFVVIAIKHAFFSFHTSMTFNALKHHTNPFFFHAYKIQPENISVDGRVGVSRAEGSTASSPWARTYNNVQSTV